MGNVKLRITHCMHIVAMATVLTGTVSLFAPESHAQCAPETNCTPEDWDWEIQSPQSYEELEPYYSDSPGINASESLFPLSSTPFDFGELDTYDLGDFEVNTSQANDADELPEKLWSEQYDQRSIPNFSPEQRTESIVPKGQGPVLQTDGNGMHYVDAQQEGQSDPVNPVNGEFYINAEDLSFPGFGIAFSHVRTYRSRIDYKGPMGHSWDFSYNRRLVKVKPPSMSFSGVNAQKYEAMLPDFEPGKVLAQKDVVLTRPGPPEPSSYCGPQLILTTGEGGNLLFQEVWNQDGLVHYESPAQKLSLQGHLSEGDTTWTLTYDSGIAEEYDLNGLMISQRDANGIGLTLDWGLGAQGDWLLFQVVDSVGREIEYEYDENDHLIRVFESVSGLQVLYEYDANGDLIEATDSKGTVEYYEYDTNLERTAANWLRESQLYEACELECAPGASSCSAGGACDRPVRDARAHCSSNCSTCAQECYSDYCVDGCNDSCAEGVGGEVGCNEQCGLYCEFYETYTGATARCNEIWEEEAKGVCEDAEDASCSGFDTVCWDEVDAYSASAGLLVDVAKCFLSIFGVSECSSPFWDAVYHCRTDTKSCCREGQNCHPNSCNAGRSFMSDCKDTFLGIYSEAPEGNTQCSKDWPEYSTEIEGHKLRTPSCIASVMNGCDQECNDFCGSECAGDCLASCSSGCDDACHVGECAGYCAELPFEDSCSEGCVAGCIDGNHERSDGVKFGYASDLNHNIIRVRDGTGAVYLENTYGTDPSLPNYDAVTHQQFGDYPVEFHYRDLEAEELGHIDPPTEGPAAEYVTARAEYVPRSMCPNRSAKPPTPSTKPKKPNELGIYWPIGEYLFGIAWPGDPIKPFLNVVRSEQQGIVPPTLLRLSAQGDVVLATASSEISGPAIRGKRSNSFDVLLSAGTAKFRPSKTQSFRVTGSAAVLAELLALEQLTLIGDKNLNLFVMAGFPLSIAHISEGSCSKPFWAYKTSSPGLLDTHDFPAPLHVQKAYDNDPAPPEIHDEDVVLMMPGCSDRLVLTPLATAVDMEKYSEYTQSGGAPFATDLFERTVLMRNRGPISLTKIAVTSGWELHRMRAVNPQEFQGKTDAAMLNLANNIPLLAPSTGEAPFFVFHRDAIGDWSDWDVVMPHDVFDRSMWYQDSEAEEGEKPAYATVLTDYHGVAWTYYYNRNGRTLRSINQGTGADYHFSYDSAGNLLGYRNPATASSCYRYDSKGNAIERTDYPGRGRGDPIYWRAEYTDHSRLHKVFDPRNGNVMATLDWDAFGNLRTTTDALGLSTTRTLVGGSGPDRANVQQLTAPNGAVSEFEYAKAMGGILKTIVDRDGASPVTSTASYDAAGNLATHLAPLGELREYSWNNGQLTGQSSQADELLNSLAYDYTPSGQLESVSRDDRTTTRTYDPTGNLRSVVVHPKEGNLPDIATCYLHSPDGRLLEMVHPEGDRVSFTYNPEGRLVEVFGGSWPSANSWDDDCPAQFVAGAPVSSVLLKREYARNGQLEREVDAAGNTTEYHYDGFGRVIQAFRVEDGSKSNLYYRFGYDELSNVIWSATRTKRRYDRPVLGEAGLLQAEERDYDGQSRVTEIRRFHFEIKSGGAGTPIGDGYATTRITYDDVGNQVTVTDDNGEVTVYLYDGAGRLVQQTLPDGSVQTTAFSHAGRTITQSHSAATPSGTIQSITNLNAFGGRESVVSNNAGTPVVFGTWSYDHHHRLIQHIPIGGTATSYAYDVFDRLSSRGTEFGNDSTETVQYHWNRNSWLTKQVSDSGLMEAETLFEYDALGRQIAIQSPGLSATHYQYEGGSGLFRQQLDPSGVLLTVARDVQGRITEQHTEVPNAPSQNQHRHFEYDALGQLWFAYTGELSASLTPWEPVTVWRRDSLGHVLDEANIIEITLSGETGTSIASATVIPDTPPAPAPYSKVHYSYVSSQYDGVGNQTSSEIGPHQFAREFDGLGRVTEISKIGHNGPLVQLNYNGLSGPTSLQQGKNLLTTYTYDAFGRLSEQQLRDTNSDELLMDQRWAIPADGVPRARYDYRQGVGERSSLYEVDNHARLLGEAHGFSGLDFALPTATGTATANQAATAAFESAVPNAADWRRYQLDGRGNWFDTESSDGSHSNEVAANDSYESFADAEATYDARGALLELDGRQYTWNSFGEMISAPGVEFTRDALGRIVAEKTANNVYVYGYDGLQVTSRDRVKLQTGTIDWLNGDGQSEEDSANSSLPTESPSYWAAEGTDYFLNGQGIDVHYAHFGTRGRYFYHQDRMGSVVGMSGVDNFGSEPVKQWAYYGAYGQRTVQTQSYSFADPAFGFQGHRMVLSPVANSQELLDMRARMFEPKLGRFLSRDPIGLAGGNNMLAFVGSAPLAFTDPLGLAKHRINATSGASPAHRYPYHEVVTGPDRELYERGCSYGECYARPYVPEMKWGTEILKLGIVGAAGLWGSPMAGMAVSAVIYGEDEGTAMFAAVTPLVGVRTMSATRQTVATLSAEAAALPTTARVARGGALRKVMPKLHLPKWAGGSGAAKGGPTIRSQLRGSPSQVRQSGTVHNIVDDGASLVVSENHFAKDIGKVFSRYNGGRPNFLRASFWKHVLPHRHVYRLPSAPEALNANWRKTFQKLGADKITIWPWQ